MVENLWGLDVTSTSAEAVADLDRAVLAYLGLRTDTGDLLKSALEADPNLAMGHVTRGCFMLLFANRDLASRAAKTLERADTIAAATPLSPRETAHLEALRSWCAGEPRESVRRWTDILVEWPKDVLALKLSEFWNFYSGDAVAMRDTAAGVLHAWRPNVPGHGFVLGMYAFGLEETGDYGRAESIGRATVEENPEDIWSAHAVAHTMEMTGRQHDGIAWIDGLAQHWGKINNFAFHVSWHKALFYYELGAYGDVLDLYDRAIRADSTGDYLDISNAAAMLVRLEMEGADIGDRWAELVDRSRERAQDHLLAFADAHYMMALASAAGDAASAGAFLDGVRAEAGRQTGMQGEVFRDIGLALCEGVHAYQSGDFGGAVDILYPIRRRIVRIGGSHAQRDVFHQMLIEAAIVGGRLSLARMLLSERTQARAGSPQAWRRYADVLAALGDAGGARDAQEKAETHNRTPSPD